MNAAMLDIEKQVNRLSLDADSLARARAVIAEELQKIKERCSGRMLPPSQYQVLQSKRTRLVADMNANLSSLQDIKAKIRLLSLNKEECRISGGTSIPDATVSELVSLRDEYQAFSADLSRVNSMRKMAAEFAMRLTKLIRSNK